MSITAGTIFERTHLPLRAWFQAAWLMTNEKLGISALGVKRSLELKRYETTWLVLHKLRRAMVDPDRELLGGEVEVDESYLGSPEPGSPGRKLLGKTIVAIAVEILPEGANDGQRAPSGRVRIARIEDTSSSSLIGFVSSNVDEGSVIYTDYWRGYLGLEKAGFIHHRTNVSATGSPAHVSLPRVHRVASLLRRWILGTHQGGVRQIEPYLEEFVFRFNRRRSTCRGLLFYRLLQLAVKIDPVTAREIIFSPTVPSTDKDVPF
jgi:transposase-like protein